MTYAINADIVYDDLTTAKYKFTAPTQVELILAGLRLSEEDRAIQSKCEQLLHFPSYPLTSRDEVKLIVCSGRLQPEISRGSGFSMQAMKIPSPSFEAKAAKLIGTGAVGGYGELKYLTAMSTTSRTERYKH